MNNKDRSKGVNIKRHRILFINPYVYPGGDTKMLLLGLPYLDSGNFSIYAASIPHGIIFTYLQTLSNTKVISMELGGKDSPVTSRSPLLIRILYACIAIAKLTSLVHHENIDIIYTGDRSVGMVISHIVSRITGCPLVLNAQIWYYLKTSFLHRQVIKNAARITVSSEEMREQFISYVPDPRRLIKIYNAIKVEKYDPRISGNEIRNEFNIPFDSSVVVLAGRIVPWKGQEEFIRAAEIVLKIRPETYFLIAGDDFNSGYLIFLEQLIKNLGIEDRVKAIGFREDIPHLFACSDIVTMPSHAEAFGLVALEAMAMKKPVIATRAGGVSEFLVDGEMGLLINPRDPQSLAEAILTLVDNPELAKTMGKKGREQVVSFYNDKIYGRQIAELFSDVVANHSLY